MHNTSYLFCVATLVPGLGWSLLLIRTGFNSNEGWWLVGTTLAAVGIAVISDLWPHAHREGAAFVTVAVTAAATAALLGPMDVVIFIQGVILLAFALARNLPSDSAAKTVSMVISGILAATLLLMLLGAWGMSH